MCILECKNGSNNTLWGLDKLAHSRNDYARSIIKVIGDSNDKTFLFPKIRSRNACAFIDP